MRSPQPSALPAAGHPHRPVRGLLGLSGVTVTVYDSAGNEVGQTFTGGSGIYTFAGGGMGAPVGLPTGNYEVEFSGGGYVTQYYNDMPSL